MSSVPPTISVVITCFNYARYVATAIASVLSQEYVKKEVIVVNDGSTDESMHVIGLYADRVRVIDQPNLGATAAYNNGFVATTGDIVILLDADDVLEPGALAQIARAWNPSIAKVQYDLKIIDADGRDLGRRFCHFTADYDIGRVRESFRRTGTYRWPVTVGNAYSRWFARAVFPLPSGYMPDGALNSVAPVYGDVVTIPRALACYRLHGANAWASNGADHTRLSARIRRRELEVALMRRHAKERGVVVPDVYVLDHELAFIHYRLMALKLGLVERGKQSDSSVALVGLACRHVVAERFPLRRGLSHVAWCCVLSLAPKPMVSTLIRIRFNRAGAVRRLKAKLGALLTRRKLKHGMAPRMTRAKV